MPDPDALFDPLDDDGDPAGEESPGTDPGSEAGAATEDRRSRGRGADRRKSVVDTRVPGSPGSGLERRRGPGRRRSDFMKAADEGEMTPEQFLFIKAVDTYKRVNQRPFPTWTEVLEVIRKLGYRKTAAMTLDIEAAEDWSEPPDAPAFPPSSGGSQDRL